MGNRLQFGRAGARRDRPMSAKFVSA